MSDNQDSLTSQYDQINDKGKRFRLLEIDGDVIREFEDGTRYNVTQKKLVHPPHKAMITEETARDMLSLKQEARRAALENGAMQAVAEKRKLNVTELGNQAVAEAWGYHATKAAMADRAPNQVSALRLVGEAFEFMPDKSHITAQDASGNRVSGPVDEVMQLWERVQAARARANDAEA